MRVLLDAACTGPGGVARHVRDLARGLVGRGLEVSVAAPTAVRDGPTGLNGDLADLPVPILTPGRPPTGTDLVHVHLADTLDSHALARILRLRLRGIPVVITEHLPHRESTDPALPFGGSTGAVYRAKTAFKRAEYALAHRTILLSEADRAFVSRRYGVPAPHLAVVPNGIPAPPAAPTPLPYLPPAETTPVATPPDAPALVLGIGTLSVQKGWDVLIAAAAGQDRWRAVIYGEGPSRSALQAQIDARHAPVRLAGWAPAQEIPFHQATLLSVPSRWEALPYVVMEAMWAGLPVVATAVDGLPELLGDTGRLIPPDNPAALGAALNDLTADPATARRLADTARARIRTHFSFDGMLDGILAVYADALVR